MSEGREWFAPKRYGWGAVPVSWQGWAVTLGFVGLLIGASRLLRFSRLAFVSIAVMLVAIFIVVIARTTRGGLGWRWGEDE